MTCAQRDDLIVITGAGQGIGRATALRLAREGARLALWDISRSTLEETAQLCSYKRDQIFTDLVDVSDPHAVVAAAHRVTSWGGHPFGVVNNAGIYPRAGLFEADASLWRKVLEVNLIGSFSCAQAFASAMVAGQRGSIVNMSSGLGIEGAARGAHYAASKAGVIALTKSLALELAPFVRVNCVVPGITETAQPLSDMDINQLHSIGSTLPLQRVGKPEDIAGVVWFLLGKDAAYITGQSLSVCGGALMRP